MSVDHYENFPVASWLCPARLRPAVRALYWFARTADDIADEGPMAARARLALLTDYRAALTRAVAGDTEGRWQAVFAPLHQAMVAHGLALQPMLDLLSAFEQDVRNPGYPDRASLLDYCRRSANPVGRLLLQLYDIDDPAARIESDAVCTALQLINFWQDLSIDLKHGRNYVPLSEARRHGLDAHALVACGDTPSTRALVHDLVDWARSLMHEGSRLVHRLPGRIGWELRLVTQGGLRILDKIEAMNHNALSLRPVLTPLDAPLTLWRAMHMRHQAPSANP